MVHEDPVGCRRIAVSTPVLDEEAAQLGRGLQVYGHNAFGDNFLAIERTIGAVPLDLIDRCVRVPTLAVIGGTGRSRQQRHDHQCYDEDPGKALHAYSPFSPVF